MIVAVNRRRKIFLQRNRSNRSDVFFSLKNRAINFLTGISTLVANLQKASRSSDQGFGFTNVVANVLFTSSDRQMTESFVLWLL